MYSGQLHQEFQKSHFSSFFMSTGRYTSSTFQNDLQPHLQHATLHQIIPHSAKTFNQPTANDLFILIM
jgi:hypothetical protein